MPFPKSSETRSWNSSSSGTVKEYPLRPNVTELLGSLFQMSVATCQCSQLQSVGVPMPPASKSVLRK